jgi:hypothetical protein
VRAIAWKQWKHGRTRYTKLRRRGVGRDLAAQTARQPTRPLAAWQQPCAQHRFVERFARLPRRRNPGAQLTCKAGPQVSVPAGTVDGYPIGLSFIGWAGGDLAARFARYFGATVAA